MTQSNSGGSLQAPAWFTDACAHPPTEHDVDVAGCRVHFLVWDPPAPSAEPPLILLHGTAAHAGWWSHLAPQLAAEGRRVAAVDLSGHGDSDHRPTYDVELWADEVFAVAAAIDPSRVGVVLVGHSLGGIVAAVAAARSTWPVHGLVQIETVRDPMGPHPEDLPSGPRRTYATEAEALARFRLLPTQEHSLSYVFDRIARGSVVEHPDGWGWKYDRHLALGLRSLVPKATDTAALVACPFAVIHSEHGVVTREDAELVARAARCRGPVVELRDAGHHPMLDQPLALLDAIRALVADWSHERTSGGTR